MAQLKYWNGVQWINAVVGAQGVQGTQGIQGTQGTAGIQGIQGTTGAQGTQGIQGLQGTQGVHGVQGVYGIQGIQGRTGTQGLIASATTPTSTDLLWLDTTSSGGLGVQGVQGIQGFGGGYNNPSEGTISTAAEGVGYMGLPQNLKSAGFTLTAADAGKHIFMTTDNQTITIPANTVLALPIGTTFTFINPVGVTTLITSTDTLYLAGDGLTGEKYLAPLGIATAIKVSSTSWIISGNGLS